MTGLVLVSTPLVLLGFHPAFIGIKLVKFAYSYFKSTFYIWILWALNPEQVTGLLLLIATLGIIGISAASALIEYYHFDFSLTPEQLEIRSGIFNRKEQSIPFQKVQQIHISEDILHRFFGLVKIKIETAGSKAEEGLILALKPTLAAAIKSSIESRAELLGGTDETTAENEAQALWELTTFWDWQKPKMRKYWLLQLQKFMAIRR